VVDVQSSVVIGDWVFVEQEAVHDHHNGHQSVHWISETWSFKPHESDNWELKTWRWHGTREFNGRLWQLMEVSEQCCMLREMYV